MRGYRAAVTRRACIKLTRIFGQGMGSLAERIHRCGDGQGCENGAEEGHHSLLLANEFPQKEDGWGVGDMQLIFLSTAADERVRPGRGCRGCLHGGP